jgi:hypothetical protein
MNPEAAPELEAQLGEFLRRHRLGLITIVFTDNVLIDLPSNPQGS